MSDPVLFQQDGKVATVTLNRPDTRNSVTAPEVLDALEAILHRINTDRSISAMILTGAGSAFSSGGNLKEMAAKSGSFAGDPNTVREGYRSGIQRIPKLLYDLDVPTIAAVNGPAIGAGCDFTLMCDIRIASENAVFAESFVRLGLIPGDGGAWLLPRAIGMSRAAEMTFTSDPVDAETALEWGLVSRVVPADGLMQSAMELAERISRNSGPALRMAKKLLREGQHTRIDTLLELSAAMQAVAHETSEYDERITKAAAKFRD
ncbi:MAG: crotonase/enoyl-CoA hydratase family protein [Rhodospirillaceae bacterium]|nr:crotonase/enoyl-CoA hydratase family protein [Rhodospirillaceae bacterium]